MSVVIVGDPNSIFIKSFIEHVVGERTDIILFTGCELERYQDFYEEYRIRIVNIKEVEKAKNFCSKAFLYWRLQIKIIKEYKAPDSVYLHFVVPCEWIKHFPICMMAQKRVVVYWGSDLVGSKKNVYSEIMHRTATSIVVMIKPQVDTFRRVFGRTFDKKINVVDFGNDIIDYIENIEKKNTIEECKREFSMDVSKKTVHIGYNEREKQQHLKLIEYLKQMDTEKLKGYQFIFPMGYGSCAENYRDRIAWEMESLNADYIIVNDYFEGERLAKFRITCDIFLYGQDKDAFSASPLEYVYAGAHFICPNWLADNYKLFSDNKVAFTFFDRFESIPSILEEIERIEGKSLEHNRKIIRDNISWDVLALKWKALK